MYSVSLANELIREAVPADSRSTLILSPMEFRVKHLMISLIISLSSRVFHLSIKVII